TEDYIEMKFTNKTTNEIEYLKIYYYDESLIATATTNIGTFNFSTENDTVVMTNLNTLEKQVVVELEPAKEFPLHRPYPGTNILFTGPVVDDPCGCGGRAWTKNWNDVYGHDYKKRLDL